MPPSPYTSDADRIAAHEFLTELRTRISTQPLPYQHGVETRALESLWEVFTHAREAMKNHPGCERFAARVTDALNSHLRPVTAKWHRAFEAGRLASRDGADAFRGDLLTAQFELRKLAADLHEMAYGRGDSDTLTPPAITPAEIDACFHPLPYGIPPGAGIHDPQAIAEINAGERQEIEARRRIFHLNPDSPTDAAGLAFSGGGIRSATFCLGIAQVLAERGLLKHMDFLSTVSGGGYTGSFLSRRLGSSPLPDPQDDVARPQGPDPEAIRYLRNRAEFLSPGGLADSWSMITATLAGMLLNWTGPLFVGALSALIIPLVFGFWKPAFWPPLVGTLACATIAGMGAYCWSLRGGRRANRNGALTLGITSALTLLASAAWLLHSGYHAVPYLISRHWAITGGIGALLAAMPVILRILPFLNTPVARAIAGRILLLAASLVLPCLAILTFYAFCYLGEVRSSPPNGRLIPAAANAAPKMPGAIFISYATEDLDAAQLVRQQLEAKGCRVFFDRSWDSLEPGSPWPPALVEAVSHQCSAFLSLISRQTETATDRWFHAERNLAAARAQKFPDAAQFYFPVIIDATLGVTAEGFRNEPHALRTLQAAQAPAGNLPDALAQRLADIQSGRPRLERLIQREWGLNVDGRLILALVAAALGLIAFFPLNVNLTAPHRLYRNRLGRTFIDVDPSQSDPVSLARLNPNQRAPYHLINTTLNIPGSKRPELRDRGCDFFLFSKLWCGSPAVGYERTDRWKMNGNDPDLATAMAVSGAAASSHMGLLSLPGIAALLAFLNVRLGFWIRNARQPGLDPNPGFGCLLREMTGIGMSETSTWLNLSDGGHVENTAAYELLRRRCKFILCVDAEADPGFTFPGLMTLVRHAQIDLGIRIQPELNPIRPDAKTGLSQSHATLCRIEYPDALSDATRPGSDANRPGAAALGLLLYVKLSVTGNESELIRRYRTNHPEFPHQSTADQFFDQEQFEAYRQLGIHVAEGLFSRALMNSAVPGVTPANAGERCRPTSIRQWFRQLAESLLEPAGPGTT